MQLSKAKRIVVKVGSSILVGEKGDVDREWLASLVDDIAALEANGTQVIVVTSGAVALGRSVLGIASGPLKLEEKQAAAACGQIRLAEAWRDCLLKRDLACAQLLITIDDSENRRRYLNARTTLEMLLDHGVIPVINENDTVATAELRFGDNDRLAARVAQMASADMLVLLSDVDGLYTGNPNTDKTAKHIPELHEDRISFEEIEKYASGVTSNVGTGGMITKIMAVKIALAAGCNAIIASGKEKNPLKALENRNNRTLFVSSSTPKSARKHWISGSIAPTGVIIVDDGAAEALKGGKSLLPAGVKAIEGRFERGDAVIIRDMKGKELGKGLIAYGHEDAARILGHKSHDIEQILGFKGRRALIHRDDLVLR